MIFINDKQNSDELRELKNKINLQLNQLDGDVDDKTLISLRKFKDELKLNAQNKSYDENIKNLKRLNKKLTFYQKFIQSLEQDVDIDPSRLLGLSDGIFGMVMTLLVFGMALPEMEILTSGDFLAFLQSIAPAFGITIVSFILISSFWIYHHEFIKIKNLNILYLWLNIFFLACLSFIPFTTSIIGNYSQFFLAEVIFGLNIFFTILSFLLMFRYAYRRNFLEKKPSEREKKYINNTFLIIMGLTVIVNLLDFNVSRNFLYLFLLVPVISTLRDIFFKIQS